MSRFDRRMILLLVLLGVVLGGLAGLAPLLGARPPELLTPRIGVRGPVGVTFTQRMQPETVQSRWQSQPPLKGSFRWEGQTLWFWPETNLDPRLEYQFSLAAGAVAEDGREIRSAAAWQVRVRSPEVAYLSPALDGSEIWSAAQDGSTRRQLTQTNHQVYDFGIGYSGEWIAFSRLNDQRGSDLWLIRRDGSAARRLVDCGGDTCAQPAWAPDGKWIAYSRRRTSVSQAEIYSPLARIWTVEVAAGKTAALFQDPTVGGVNPVWAPDGQRLAFWDPRAGLIHIIEIETGKQWLLASRLGIVGTWSVDGQRLWYSDFESGDLNPLSSGYVADTATNQIRRLFAGLVDPEDFGLAVPSPDESQVVVGVRLSGGSRSVQLDLMAPDGSARRVLTQDPLFSHGAYRWDPTGGQIVYQRVQIASSSARPEIWIWDQSSGVSRKLAADAALPAWLP